MKCNPLRWLWGVVLVFGLLGIANMRGSLAEIEAGLRQASQSALQKAGMEWAEVEFDGRDATLSGNASDDVEQRAAQQLTRKFWGVRKVRDRTELVEEQRNYSWTASLRDSRLRMYGYVPNENVRRAIVGAAKATFPQLEIDDRLKRARGAPEPEAWLGAISFSLKQLSGLKPGARVELEGDVLTVSGEAETSAAYQNVKNALTNGVPQGIKVKSENVVPPRAKPFVWTAKLAPRQLQLTGYVPSEQVREAIAAVAQKEFGKRTIVDRMQIASGEPDNMAAAATSALRKLAQLDEGAVELRNREIELSGLAAKQETVETLRRDLQSGIPDGFKISEQIKFREPSIATVSPYTTSLVLEGTVVRLAGHVPTDAARASLVGAIRARFGDRRLIDETQLGVGAPEGWSACMTAGLQGLAKLGNGQIELVDNGLRFVAATEDDATAESIRDEVRAAANRACDALFNITVNEPPEPELNWRAVSSAEGLLFEGEVPDQATRIALSEMATKLFPKSPLIDRTRVNAGYAKKWSKVADLGLKVLAKLRAGEARLVGLELLVSGQAPDTAIATAVRQQLRDLPKGYSGRDMIQVRSDAMIWAEQEARKKAEAEARKKIEDEQRREDEERRKREELARKPADQSQTVAVPVAPAPTQPAQQDPVRTARTQPPAAQTQPPAPPETRSPVRPAPAPAPEQQAALKPATDKPADAEACRSAVNATGERGVVRFDRASSDLSSEGIATLQQLIEAAGACGRLSITIEGHADAEGTPERNQALSERRAQAVAEYLADRGVATNRLSSVGYGATQPLAPNTTAESRALNRRVEFTVKVN